MCDPVLRVRERALQLRVLAQRLPGTGGVVLDAPIAVEIGADRQFPAFEEFQIAVGDEAWEIPEAFMAANS